MRRRSIIHAAGPRGTGAGGPKYGRDAVVVGILFSLAGVVLFNISDATAKYMTRQVSILQVAWALYVWMILLSWLLAPGRRIAALARTRHPRLQFVQAGCEVAGGLLFYAALYYLPFADVVALGFVSPFFVTLLAALILGEAVGPARWLACGFGFLGAIIILRPGFASFGWPSLLPIAAALFYAFYAVVTRLIGPRESSATMLFYIGITGTALLAAPMASLWVAPSPAEWLGLAVVGLFGAWGRFVVIRSYSLAPASLLQPLRYAQIVGATVLGLVVFGDFPDGWTWLGTAVIVLSGASFYAGEARRRRGASGASGT